MKHEKLSIKLASILQKGNGHGVSGNRRYPSQRSQPVSEDDEEYWLERGRQWWKASAARIIDCAELLVLDKNDYVKAVARVAGVEKDLDEGTGRISIIPSELPAKHELIGKKIRRPESRNPVVYLRDIEVIG